MIINSSEHNIRIKHSLIMRLRVTVTSYLIRL